MAADQYISEDYKVGKLTPITDPLALKAVTVRDYKANYLKMGVALDADLVERMAVNDLELVANHRRGQNASPNYKSTKKPAKRQGAEAAATAAFQKDGTRLNVRQRRAVPGKQRGKGILDVPANEIDEKWMYMSGRLKRIAAGACSHVDRIQSLSTTECPLLAERIYQAQVHYMFRGRDHKSNPFRTMAGKILSEKDAFRKLRRMLEDICDASSVHLGPWWVPK